MRFSGSVNVSNGVRFATRNSVCCGGEAGQGIHFFGSASAGGFLQELWMNSAHVLASREVGVRLEHPPARVSLFRAALPLCHPQWVVRVRLRTCSIAHSLARTIVTCSKSAPPSNLAPRRRRPKTRRPHSADYFFGAARPKCRQPTDLPNEHTSVCGVAALGSGCAAEPKASRRRGASCVGFRGFLSVTRDRALLQSICAKPYKANVGAIVGSGALCELGRTIWDMFD